MRGYLNLFILGYLPWIMVKELTPYFSAEFIVLLSWAVITPFSYKAIKVRDYISVLFVSGFVAYSINLLYPIMIFALYAKNIMLISGLIVIYSVIRSKPCTCIHAKLSTTEDKWEHPLFLTINNIISLVWAGIFISGYIFEALKLPHYSLINVTLVIFGFEFSRRFPEYYKTRKVLLTISTESS